MKTIKDEMVYLDGEQNLVYTCKFEGFPPPNIAFYFNGAAISAGSDMTVIGDTLTIPSPQVFHSGVYQCIINSEIGDDQLAWFLEIREPSQLTASKPYTIIIIYHKIIVIPQVQPYNYSEFHTSFDDPDIGVLFVLNSSSTVRLSVDILADPCPSVEWSLNGTALDPSNNTIITYNNPCIEGAGSSLVWTYTLNVVLTSDTSGQYLANFTNIAGTVFLPKTYLTVPGRLI